MSDERRFFNGGERVALYLAADGRCARCGRELVPGWHADHVDPHTLGGPTDVVNGQALCPPCNLLKGIKTVTDLRAWQAEALERVLRRPDDFLCVATPGAGKTRFAVAAATRLIERGDVSRVFVVVPTSHLRIQWAQAAARFGLQLDPTYSNAAGALASDYDGAVVTYAAVDSAALLYRKHSSDKPSLVILDEVHHAGDARSWGTSIRTAFEMAARRLALSGTPFRSDGQPIPFIRYDEQQRCLADYTYDYADALGDQNNNVVRQIQFHAFDGEARWREAWAVESKIRLSDVDDETRAKALSSALHPDGAWIASVLRQADVQLSIDRQTTPDAGGLVVARGQAEARRYAALLRTICGEEPALVISDEPEASARITAFTSSRSRWIVAVAMVSEGVDIARLTVGVYATNVAAELFFRQVVGRFVRTRPSDEDIVASLFIPSVQPLLGYAAEIERMIPKALEEAVARAEAQRKDSVQLEINMVEPLASSEAVHLTTILGGEQFADEELRHAEQMARAVGMPSNVSPAHIARLLRIAGSPRATTTMVEIPAVALVDEKKQVRRLITSKVNRLARLTDRPHNYINADLNRACGTNIAAADLAGLKHRLVLLDRWIDEAQP